MGYMWVPIAMEFGEDATTNAMNEEIWNAKVARSEERDDSMSTKL